MNSEASPAIRCRDLRKAFGAVRAVDGIDLEIPRGECFGLLGPNGAGKTTTIEILEGLTPRDSGEVEILGLRWDSDARAIRRRIGVSLQESRTTEKLTVFETLRLFRSFYDDGIDPEEAMRFLSLEEKRNTWVMKLSGGQRQRLAVACALVGDPEVLFLDDRRPVSIPRAASSSGIACRTFASGERRSSSRRTTWRRPSASASASRSWITAGSSRRAPPPS